MKRKINITTGDAQIKAVLIIGALLLLFTSCKKYLEIKPDKTLEVPNKVQDYQAILDDKNLNDLYPSAGDIGCDDYFLKYTTWQSVRFNQQKIYIWDPNAVNDQEWQYSYTLVEDANVVLDGLNTLPNTNDPSLNVLRGSAYFYRGFTFFQLANIFTMPYNSATSNSTDGLPLKLTSSITEKLVRSNLETTYQQIIKDLKKAVSLLPVTPLVKTRPSKPAAYGALARVYLTMGNYQSANNYADSCLQLYNKLMNYNTLKPTSLNPIALFNDEVIFHAVDAGSAGVLSSSRALVDTNLYASYSANDLRQTIFFKPKNGYYAFKGDYSGQSFGQLFMGIATDEVLLIRSETYARLGNINAAINDLNSLLVTRYATGSFSPYDTNMSAADALTLILQERRKELAFRGELRWIDLRRLNLDSRFAKTIIRSLNGIVYTLSPNDYRYALLLPLNVVAMDGFTQNKR